MRTLTAIGAAAIALVSAAAPAAARTHVFLGFNFGAPAYYAPYPYYPPPVYYYPPPVTYYQPPPGAYYQAPATPAQITLGRPVGGNCREFTAPATIDGRTVQTYGTACQQSDGSWRIVAQ
jgi:hypothetical protein